MGDKIKLITGEPMEKARHYLRECAKINEMAMSPSTRIDCLVLAVHSLADLLEKQGDSPTKED